eukprot:scaffold1457_cov350-Prasinococcus_capsulatus_cf.AAC.11
MSARAPVQLLLHGVVKQTPQRTGRLHGLDSDNHLADAPATSQLSEGSGKVRKGERPGDVRLQGAAGEQLADGAHVIAAALHQQEACVHARLLGPLQRCLRRRARQTDDAAAALGDGDAFVQIVAAQGVQHKVHLAHNVFEGLLAVVDVLVSTKRVHDEGLVLRR